MYVPTCDLDPADAFDLAGFLADCRAGEAADAEAEEAAVAAYLRFAFRTEASGSVEAPADESAHA